jgi:hypothetical protein
VVEHPYDHVVHAGRLVCPVTGLDGPGGVAIRGGRIAAAGPVIDGSGRETLHFPDALVLPGLVDLHAHPARGNSKYGVDPDLHLLPYGTTTVLAQGDAGADTWPRYREAVIEASLTRIRLALNLSRRGESMPGGCFESLADADVAACVRVARAGAGAICSYLLQEDKELAAKTGLYPAPGGPAGRMKRVYVDYYGVFKASPYPDIAKGLIRHFLDPKNYNEFITGTAGRYLPVYPKHLEDPFWTSKREFAGLVEIGRDVETIGREGRITAALGEVVAQSLLAKSVQTVLVNDVDPAEAVAKAHAEIIAIYKRFNEPV